MEDQNLKKRINKRKKISSKLKENIVIISDKEKTVDSGEETNKQKLSDNLDIFDISQKISHINVSIDSKKRIEISSADLSNIDIVEDKEKSPTSDEPLQKYNKIMKTIISDYQKDQEKTKEIKNWRNINFLIIIIISKSSFPWTFSQYS